MTVSHEGRLDELVGPKSIPYPTNMSHHMLSLEEQTLDLVRQFVLGPQVVQPISSIVNVSDGNELIA